MDPLIVIFGLGVGLLVGATGIGGASLMTPLLIMIFGIKPVTAIGTDLAYGAVTKTLGGWRHLRQGTVHLRLSTWLAVGSIPGAVLGVWLLGRLQDAIGSRFDLILLLMIAAAVLLVGTIALGRVLFRRSAGDGETPDPVLDRRAKVRAVALGLPVGAVLGVTSVGSGVLIALGLIVIFKLTPHRVVGTDVFHAAMLLWVAAGAHVLAGNVDFALTGNLLVGSLPGVWVGARLAMRIPERALRPTLGIVLLDVGLALVGRSGLTSVSPVLLVALPAALGAVTWAVQSRRARAARAVVGPREIAAERP